MTATDPHPPGTFCWPELATTDSAAAKKFYGGLLGWTFDDQEVAPGMVYTRIKSGGKEVGGLHAMQPEQASSGVPPHWMGYVAVASADETTAKAREFGGTVVVEPMDVMDLGRLSVLQDPTGATFALWQPKSHTGASLLGQPGSMCWNELATNDTKKAATFYEKVFGWDRNEMSMGGGGTYTMFMNGDKPAGGMLQMTEEWKGAPPHWVVYFAVADCDASAEKATGLGGKVLVPPTDIPNVGRFAKVQDPQGATFSIIKLTQPS